MVNYGSLYRPKHRQHKATSTTSRPSDTPSAPDWASSSGRSNFTADSVTPDAYLNFNDQQQDALLLDARANAAALLVDAVADADKWQFVTARGPLNIYELRADSMERVSSMTPADPTQLAQHMHTMLATTRVRATLDDFMRLVASPKRDTFQNVQAALFEDRVQMADVFTSFGSLPSGRVGRSSSTSSSISSSSRSQSGAETEQYAVKYVSIKGRAARTNSGAALNGSSASNSLKFGGKNRHRERQAARLQSGNGRQAEGAQEQGLTMCLAEYATIRRAQIRGPMAHNQAQDFDDQRVGIISHHSIEDPGVTRYCQPIVTAADTKAKTSQAANFVTTARALVQFSGIVAYPVASTVAGENVLEVLIKFSCYDANGVTTTRRMNMLSYLTAFQQLNTALLVMRLRESPYLTSENWVKSRKSCCVCQGKFTMSRRKHHCRLCGDVACSKCSEIHQIKLGKAGKCPFRICINCERGQDDNQRLSRGQMNVQAQGAAQPPRTPVNGINALRRRLGSGSGSAVSRSPEDDDEYNRPPSTNSSSGDSSDFYDSRGLLSSHASTNPDRTLSNMSGSTVSSFNSSRGLGAFGKSGSSKTLSISGSSFGGSFYKQSNASNATTVSSSRGSRFDYESENDVEGNDIEGKDDSDTEKSVEVAQEVEREPDVDSNTVDIDSIEATEVASVCSSSPSSPSSAVIQSDQFYKRFSELSLMDFHDSEFDLSIKGGLPGRMTGKSVYDFDDSEADPDSDHEDLGGIGEEENEDGEDEDVEDICDFDMRELDEADEDDEDDGMEFHDSNVGLDFKLQDLNLQDYQGLDELEEGDEEFDEEIVEEIHTDVVLARSRVGTPLDEERAARLEEYGVMDSGKEHIYDLVAKQAAQHSSCSIATISFVDARREFIKSSFGLVRDRELSEVPITHSLTAEIMRRFPARKADVSIDGDDDAEVVTVLDARRDDALATNLFVTEAPNLRFVMGVPFRARDGIVLGALIVADSQPRTVVPARQRSLLKDLAEQVSALLEDQWTRNQERNKLASSQTGQLRDQLVDLLSQSYTTGLQMQQNERKMEQSTTSLSSSAHKPQYAKDFRHMQSVEL